MDKMIFGYKQQIACRQRRNRFYTDCEYFDVSCKVLNKSDNFLFKAISRSAVDIIEEEIYDILYQAM